jgi:hypothetical protein
MTTALGMTSPQTIDGMSVDALLQQVWNNKAYLESVKPDPIFNNKDLIMPVSVVDRQAIPATDQLFINVTPKNTGARNITLAFVAAFDMNPVEGNSQFIGNETDFEMKFTKCYANDWAGGVTLQNFGIDARELKNYGLNMEARRLLYQWRTEILGYYAREALVQRISHNLTASPISLTQSYNKNWWVPSLSDSSQPAYDTTAASFATNIGTAMQSAGMNAVLTPSYLLQLIDYLENQYIMPIRISGKPYYVMLVAPREIRRLRDPAVTNSFGAYFKEAAAIQDVNKVIPTAELVVGDNLILVRDPRIPTTTISGTASAYTLTFGYDKAGRSTTKTSGVSAAGATNYWYNNIVMGAGALMWFEPEKAHDEKQPDEYTQYEGNALFGAIGYQTPVWNIDDDQDTASTAQQESSFIVPTVKA